MLTSIKKTKLVNALKSYKKAYLDRNMTELDESGTRLMINTFLSDVLGFLPLEEIKTEYMIKGTYADYVIQTGGIRHFLVEVKAYSLSLSDKHLRQTVNYGANEGIEWALLTNGKQFDFYKILFTKPIDSKKVFSIDLTDPDSFKAASDSLQYLHKEAIPKKGLKLLWNKCEAINPLTITSILFSKEVIDVIKKVIKKKYNEKFEDTQILKCLHRIAMDKIDPTQIKVFKSGKGDKKPAVSKKTEQIIEEVKAEIIEEKAHQNGQL